VFTPTQITPDEEEELLNHIAKKIHLYKLDSIAVLLVESTKPIMYIGSEMGRFFISPFTPLISNEFSMKTDKVLMTLGKRENLEKLLKKIEKLEKEENEAQEIPPIDNEEK
jgi:hypothetical protein